MVTHGNHPVIGNYTVSYTVHFRGSHRLEGHHWLPFVTLGWMIMWNFKFERNEDHNFTIATNTSQQVEFFLSLICYYESPMEFNNSWWWFLLIIALLLHARLSKIIKSIITIRTNKYVHRINFAIVFVQSCTLYNLSGIYSCFRRGNCPAPGST